MSTFFTELKRRNLLRAAMLYIGAAWALAQGIAQLGLKRCNLIGVIEWHLLALPLEN